MIFTHVKDNPDGSADYLVDLTDEETEILVEEGIIAVIKTTLRKQEGAAGYRVGNEVFATELEAKNYQRMFTQHDILPLYK